jgi:hypothetical protein
MEHSTPETPVSSSDRPVRSAPDSASRPSRPDLPATQPSSLPRRVSRWFSGLSAWQKALVLLIIPVLGVGSYGVYAYQRQTHKPLACEMTASCDEQEAVAASPDAPQTTPTPALVPADLDGTRVEAEKASLHPLAVMIENHPEARPQFGLSQAAGVIEAQAEGGITRFMALYRDPSAPVRVGPIRSARPYFVDIATEYNAFYAHVGGNDTALQQIRNTGVLDLNQFSIGEPVFKRDYSRGVATEHTMYSNTQSLWEFATQRNRWSSTGEYPVWKFQDDADPSQRPPTQKVTVDVSDPLYRVAWEYDQASNSYRRTMAGIPHTDAATNAVITTKTIILQTVQRTPHVTRINEQGWLFTLNGSGNATVIQNGQVIPATWKKENGRTRFYHADGTEISLVRGGWWLHLIHPDSRVSW